eukprot:6651532-Pyramimonas_sp.AAC.1
MAKALLPREVLLIRSPLEGYCSLRGALSLTATPVEMRVGGGAVRGQGAGDGVTEDEGLGDGYPVDAHLPDQQQVPDAAQQRLLGGDKDLLRVFRQVGTGWQRKNVVPRI